MYESYEFYLQVVYFMVLKVFRKAVVYSGRYFKIKIISCY